MNFRLKLLFSSLLIILSSSSFAQCTLTGTTSYSSQGIANLFKPSGPCNGENTIDIADGAVISISGQWDLVTLGIQSITVKGSGSIIFANNDDVTLVGTADIIIEDPTNSSALALTGGADPASIYITIGTTTYTGNDFASIISGGGANEAGINPPLDVELSLFEATVRNEVVHLNWQTLSETDNYGFELERKTNGDWEKITFVEGYGNSSNIIDYEFNDIFPDMGINYYRLKAIDYDGTIEYSSIVSVNIENKVNNSIVISPNPAFDFVSLKTNQSGLNHVEIYSLDGKKVLEGSFTTSHLLDVSTLQAGVYFVRIENNGVLSRKKITIL